MFTTLFRETYRLSHISKHSLRQGPVVVIVVNGACYPKIFSYGVFWGKRSSRQRVPLTLLVNGRFPSLVLPWENSPLQRMGQ